MSTSSDLSESTSGASLEGMPSILFPVRVFPCNNQDNDQVHSIGSSESFETTTTTTSAVRWVGMTPLGMVEMLAAMTEDQESSGQLRPTTNNDPLRIGDIKLSSKSAVMKFPKDLLKAPLSPNSPLSSNFSASEGESTTPDSKEHSPSQSSSSWNQNPHSSWNVRAFVKSDPYSVATIEKIASLGTVVESLANFDKLVQSYRRTQEHFVGTFHWIMQQYHRNPAPDGREQRHFLNMLYNETIQKMEALIVMAQQNVDDPRPAIVDDLNPAMVQPLSVIIQPKINDPKPTTVQSSSPRPTSKATPSTKQNLSNYMTNWLRENWTNPYPDEKGVAEMAEDCGTTPSVVSNWLINARTRKWRPAIKQAYQMQRPVDYLLEDSIHIFEGKPIPGFENMDIKARHPRKRTRACND